jgi:uncharacterized protein YceK
MQLLRTLILLFAPLSILLAGCGTVLSSAPICIKDRL